MSSVKEKIEVFLSSKLDEDASLCKLYGVQRSGQTTQNTECGNFVKNDGPFVIAKRTKGGQDFYDFIEKGPSFKISSDSSLIYTYSKTKGNLTYGASSLWARQELLTASQSAQKAGKKAAVPNDLEFAIKTAKEHYAKYRGK